MPWKIVAIFPSITPARAVWLRSPCRAKVGDKDISAVRLRRLPTDGRQDQIARLRAIAEMFSARQVDARWSPRKVWLAR